MKKQIRAMLLGLGFTFAAAGASHAMSSLISLSSQAMWPTSSKPDGNLVYTVTTVGRAGAGLLEVTLTASNMPAGVTVTFSPAVLRFTGNQVTAQTATMTVHCPYPIPLDCYAFTLTGTAQRESITITNVVMFTPEYVATRPATLYLDNLGQGSLRVRGLGATAKTYQIEAKADVDAGVRPLSAIAPAWVPLGLATADGNGRFTFFTSQVPGAATRFYRSVEVTQ